MSHPFQIWSICATTKDTDQPNLSLEPTTYICILVFRSQCVYNYMYIWKFSLYFFKVLSHPTMSILFIRFFIWVLLTVKCFVGLLGSASASWCQHHHLFPQPNRQFQQKTDRFWEFKEQTNSWVEVELPYDLVSCVNDNCTVVASIDPTNKKEEVLETQAEDVPRLRESSKKKVDGYDQEEVTGDVLPMRKRVSLTKMTDASIWVTGQSGSIYERFWNGVQWVIAPHDLPISGAHAVSVFLFNHTILALSEAGILYQVLIL